MTAPSGAAGADVGGPADVPGPATGEGQHSGAEAWPSPRRARRTGRRAEGTGALRVVPLLLGSVELPKSCSVHGAPDDVRLREPVPGVLVQVDGGWVLLDTGYNPALLADPALRRRFHDRFAGIVPLLPPGDDDPLLGALDHAGVAVPAIAAVAVSHLHSDHTGGIRHFAGRVPVHLQRAELAFGLSGPEAEANGMARVDYDDPAIDWHLADGDTDIAPGIRALATPGHTPGHQSFVVRYDKAVGGGGFVFAFDAADLTENIAHEAPVGETIGVSPAETVLHIRRLKALAAQQGLRLVPGHDPVVWPRLIGDLAATGGVPRPT